MRGRALLPLTLTLPSGRRVKLVCTAPEPDDAREGRTDRAEGTPLFSDVMTRFERGDVTAVEVGRAGPPIDVRDLALADFHVLRAVLTNAGLVAEDEVEIGCRNCDALIVVHPCDALELGPWIDGELGDEELDATLPFGEPHDIAPIALGRVRVARTVTLAPRTVGQAAPLFEALARDALEVTPVVVTAMGIEALGAERDPARIAAALEACDDDAFAAVTDAFLAAHYPLRLGSVTLCPTCGARNDVDAPYDREFAAGAAHDEAREHASTEAVAVAAERRAGDAFPTFDAFAVRAKLLASPMLARVPGDPVELIVEGGTPAVDDGGEPLLGSYVPPHPGDLGTPSRPPTVTVFYRTFRAMWDEDGPYDWQDELRETMEHELEHHIYFLRGDDPMDDEERAEIRDEAVRIVGRREAERREISTFATSIVDFFRRTWPIWILVLGATLLSLCSER